ncbi:sucrase ferredoxin [Alkalinema pantanalense CENA528]|uniref:sucrase ferredoxin n=1 Tax=Alkalinema pantanalense TaxID=1620705 RepID=UPI003D6FA095
MEKFFCAEASRCAQEDPIGTASPVQTYVLVECPQPWAASAIDSRAIPEALRRVMQDIQSQNPMKQSISQRENQFSGQPNHQLSIQRHYFKTVKFLLIHRNTTQTTGCQTVLIYHQKAGAFCNGYDRYEFSVQGLEQAAQVIQQFFCQPPAPTRTRDRVEDLLICTHGSHDQCCARYGNPFYAQACKVVSSLAESDRTIQVWRSSHFGGHRFAPTAITFPDGRYYARLDPFSLKSILTRSGHIQLLSQIYRGWGILPPELQVMERSLWMQLGWDWAGVAIAHHILEHQPDQQSLKVVLQYLEAGSLHHCYGQLVADPDRSLDLKPSCHAVQASFYPKYKLEKLHFQSDTFVSMGKVGNHSL